jgi:ESCRT-II complex subunit VPS36
LAKELSDFIVPILKSKGGSLSMMDVYCLFNRARGIELISPQDLKEACKLTRSLNLPIHVRKCKSGLLLLQHIDQNDDILANQLYQLAMQHGPLTSIKLAHLLKISPLLAQEHLLVAESLGQLCRDETSQSIYFYPNEIKDCQWHFIIKE